MGAEERQEGDRRVVAAGKCRARSIYGEVFLRMEGTSSCLWIKGNSSRMRRVKLEGKSVLPFDPTGCPHSTSKRGRAWPCSPDHQVVSVDGSHKPYQAEACPGG